MMEDIIRSSPGALTAFQRAGVHGMISRVARVDVLADILQPNSRTARLLQSVLQPLTDVHPGALSLGFLLPRGILRFLRQTQNVPLLIAGLANVFVPLEWGLYFGYYKRGYEGHC